MTVPNKSAVAGYGPASSLDDYARSTWANLHDFLLQSLHTDDLRELGPAVNAAPLLFVALYGPSAPVSRDSIETMPLLGGPTLILPLPPPKRYVVVTAPAYHHSVPLNQLIAQREAQGFDVTVYRVDECFGQTSVREADKGAVAYICASNHVYWGSAEAWRPSAILEKAFC